MTSPTEVTTEAQALLDAAAPGPWTFDWQDDCQVIFSGKTEIAYLDGEAFDTATLIAAVPELITALLAEVGRVSAERDVWMRRATVAETDASAARDRLLVARSFVFAARHAVEVACIDEWLNRHDEALAVRRD